MKDWEYVPHLKSCVIITVHIDTPSLATQLAPEVLAFECQRIAAEDQARAHRAFTTDQTPKTVEDPYLKQRRYQQNTMQQNSGADQSPPPGKTRCLTCNGLSRMYPDCVPCNATGWVDISS